ncbi:MATH domain and coiled-coil domain-containing protein At3g58360 [Linum perenne]
MMKNEEAGDGEMLLDTKDFTWKITNFSKLKDEIYSDAFVAGGHRWRVLCFPKGNDVDFLSLYLDFADWETMPPRWSKYADFNFNSRQPIQLHPFQKILCKNVSFDLLQLQNTCLRKMRRIGGSHLLLVSLSFTIVVKDSLSTIPSLFKLEFQR